MNGDNIVKEMEFETGILLIYFSLMTIGCIKKINI